MLARLAWLCPLVLTACVRDDPDHCANQDGDGDAYCAEKYDGGFCSKCIAKHDGCVEIQADIPGSCRPDNVTTAADDDATTDPSATSTPTDTIADDSASETTTTTTSGDATEDGGSSSSGAPQPVCGDGLIEDPELCEPADQNGYTCRATQHGDEDATCDPVACEPNFDMCSNPAAICGDGVINTAAEDCDGEDFDDQTCDKQPGHGAAGMLACTKDCQIDASGCCLDGGEICTESAQCCLGICDLLGSGQCTL